MWNRCITYIFVIQILTCAQLYFQICNTSGEYNLYYTIRLSLPLLVKIINSLHVHIGGVSYYATMNLDWV